MDEISFNHLETEKEIVILKLLVPRYFFFFPLGPGGRGGGGGNRLYKIKNYKRNFSI